MPLGLALIPIVVLIGSLGVVTVGWGLTAHLPLVAAASVAGVIAWWRGMTWAALHEGVVGGIGLGLGAILILLAVGALIGSWVIGGIVPTMIWYGLKAFSPGAFLVGTLLVCSVVSLGTGSSWATVGTVGIALMGVGKGLGVPLPMVAGAVVSGAYFGDKMSPLSDTTNLAPGVAGTDLFTHIRHMVYTTGPSYLVAMGLYAFVGWSYAGRDFDPGELKAILASLEDGFTIHPLLLLPPVAVMVMVSRRTPPLPSILAGALMGMVCAVAAQGRSMAPVVEATYAGYVSETGMKAVDELLTRGGVAGMMETVALILCALGFGGILERAGMLETLTGALLRRVRSTGGLVLATELTCIGSNTLAPDQYLSIVVPGRMYREAFAARGLHPKNLSRCLEDAGTLSSPLVPWNSCGAFVGAALGVSAAAYFPFAFFNLINPLVSVIYGYAGLTMERLPGAKTEGASAVAGEEV
jgi:NhaC family Na+:H+ antiporter